MLSSRPLNAIYKDAEILKDRLLSPQQPTRHSPLNWSRMSDITFHFDSKYRTKLTSHFVFLPDRRVEESRNILPEYLVSLA